MHNAFITCNKHASPDGGSGTVRQILSLHAVKYPLMQPEDAVKLLYQQTFGIGHLITDPRSFAERLYREMAEVRPIPGLPLTEPIGGGMVRVMLNSPEIVRLDPEELIKSCLRTAAEKPGRPEAFEEKLTVLGAVCREGLFVFTGAALDRYLQDYRAAGFPPVSHSRIYSEAYHPSYRVAAFLLLPVI